MLKKSRLVLISIFSKYRTWNLSNEIVEKLSHEFPEFKFIQTKNKSEFLKYIPETEILLSFRFSAKDFLIAKKLKWIHFGGAGVGRIIFDQLLQSDVIITKSAGINTEAVAEMAWSFILALAKMFPAWLENKNNGDILSDRINFFNTKSLFDKTLGIIGLGNIGRNIARIGKVFGMKVIGTRRKFNEPLDNVDEVFSPDNIYEVLKQSDFLVIAVPITPATERMIGEQEFESMKDGVFIVNISRGRIIKEDLLIKYLKSGKVAGAGLDVIENEPIAPDNELYKLQNVILTPHIAGFHDQYWERLYEMLRANFKRYLNDEELTNQIDKQFRY